MEDTSSIQSLPGDPEALKQIILNLSRERDDWQGRFLRVQNEKQRIEVEKLRIETEKRQIEVEKLRIETEKRQIEVEKLRIEMELLRLKKMYYGPDTPKGSGVFDLKWRIG